VFRGFDSDSVEAVLALVVAAGSAGVLVGYGAAAHPELVVGYGVGYGGLALGSVLFAVVLGRLPGWLLDAGEIPKTGIAVDAPDNATTGFYAVALGVMLVGLVFEVATGSPNPLYMLVFIAGGFVCFQRGFRRGLRRTTTTSR
jgi:hypothetical protein